MLQVRTMVPLPQKHAMDSVFRSIDTGSNLAHSASAASLSEPVPPPVKTVYNGSPHRITLFAEQTHLIGFRAAVLSRLQRRCFFASMPEVIIKKFHGNHRDLLLGVLIKLPKQSHKTPVILV